MAKKIPKPPIKLRKFFAPVILACRNAIITSPAQTSGTGNGDRGVCINIIWPDEWERPEGFPQGRSEGGNKYRHSCVSLLKWFKLNRFTDYDAKDLFRARLPIMMVNAQMEVQLLKLLDTSKEYEYNDCYE